MGQLPASAPESARDAFAQCNAATHPTIDELKLMVYLEASGRVSYGELAKGAPNPGIRKLLEANGREELAHAHRVAKVIERLTGEAFEVPDAADNPYATPRPGVVDRAVLEMLVKAEDNGCVLYETWADNIGDAKAAALLRQNAKEETRHGQRAKDALALLAS